jgi:transposase InsO family protein
LEQGIALLKLKIAAVVSTCFFSPISREDFMHSDVLAWQAFRISLLSPLITGEVTYEDREAYFQKLAKQEHYAPHGKITLSVRTLRRWYARYRKEGIEGLKPKRRNDLGKPRKRNQAKVDRAEAAKRENPVRSDITINKLLQSEFASELPASTMYRHLRLRGATKAQLGIIEEKVRCRWTRDVPNALWMGDYSHGPKALVNGRVLQTYLSLWIDSHSRYIVEARYYVRENLDCLVDSLLRAWAKHGCPRELYTDNGAVYRSHALTIACGQLQITKLHRPPREPQPGGLVERVFQTIGSQFASEIEFSKNTYNLTELNQAFFAYLDTTYHRTVHSQTGCAPFDRYFSERRVVRPVAIESVQSYFFERVIRKVDSTHSDVSIESRTYRVDPRWRGMKVYVQYDPYRIDGDSPDEVTIYNELDVYLGIGTRWNRERGGNGPGMPMPKKTEPPNRSPVIETYLNEHKQRQKEAQQGIDYRSAMRRGQLTLWTFGSLVSKTLGKSGGLSSFNVHEQLTLETFFQKHPQVRSLHVQEAAKKAAGEGFQSLLWNLQLLLEGEPS